MSKHNRFAHGKRSAALVMALAIVTCSRSPLYAQAGKITGVLRNVAGDPVAGALVKVRSEDLGLGLMVVSQAQGRYSTPNLPPGKYKVQAFGGSYQSALAGPVESSSGHQGTMDLVLSAPLQIPPREKRMTNADYEALMPDKDDSYVKDSFVPVCSECHGLEWIISARKTPEQWRETVNRMQEKMMGEWRVLIWRFAEQLVEDGKMMKYLSKNFTPDTPLDPRVLKGRLLGPGGPSHPNRNLPTTLLKGAASKYVAMEFSLPPGSAPQDIAADSHGIAWVS